MMTKMPYLSSIMTDSQRIGRAAMRMLTGMLTIGKRPTKAVLVPPVAVTERQSTDTVPTTDCLVQDAVRLMRERCASLESAVALAQALGVSAEELDERVTRALRRGVAAELRRVRVERAKHLLRVTDLSLGKVARECGFSSAASFARDFRQEAGLAPSGYRVKAREQTQAQQDPA
jgi:LacI family transcriptional regulator